MRNGSYIDAAGGVVWRRREDGKREFLVVHRPRYDDWSLPKGKLDAGESYESCAEREVLEETGYSVKMGDEIGTVAYVTPSGNPKRVRYWLMLQLDGEFHPNGEVDDLRWLRPRKARALLGYPRDRTVFDRGLNLVKRRRSGRIYLVRHALAGDRKQWQGVDRNRPLSLRGARQARDLADHLSSVPITDVVSSKWVRCIETVAPLASLIDLEVQRHPALAEGADRRRLEDLIRSLAGRTAVLCSHGDVIQEYLDRLAAKGVSLDGPAKWKKASTWVLDTQKGRVTSGRYLPPVGM